jgi:hypothetical protein
MAAPRKRYLRLARRRKGASSFFSCRRINGPPPQPFDFTAIHLKRRADLS